MLKPVQLGVSVLIFWLINSTVTKSQDLPPPDGNNSEPPALNLDQAPPLVEPTINAPSEDENPAPVSENQADATSDQPPIIKSPLPDLGIRHYSFILKLGYNSLGLEEHLMQQYSGNENFAKAVNSGYFNWFKLGVVRDLDIAVIKSFGVSFEQAKFSQDMADMFPDGIPINTPRLRYDATASVLVLDFYVFQSFSRGFHPLKIFFGFGYGALDGEIAEDIAAPTFSSEISGAYGFNEFGFMVLGDYLGLNFSIRQITKGDVLAEEDYFNQREADDEKLPLEFSGVTANLGITIRL